MITKERLQELIEQDATIWTVNSSGNINPVKTNKTCEIQRQYLMKEGQIYSYIEQTFETQEEAEWHKEFGNIARTERLELPTWEGFIEMEEVCFFQKNHKQTILRILGTKYLAVETNFERYYTGDLTKENYILACRKCKELFLGGNYEINND